MTEYSKHRLKMMLDDVSDVAKAFEKYLDAEYHAESYYDPPHPKKNPVDKYEAPCIEIEKYWDAIDLEVRSVAELVERETHAMELLGDMLEDEHLRKELSKGVDPSVMPFTEEDYGMAVNA